MKDSVVQFEQEQSGSVLTVDENPQSVVDDVASLLSIVPDTGSSLYIPSYKPTPWPIVDRLLTFVDKVSGGKAGLVQRFFSFAFFGGIAALVNLLVFFTVFYLIPLPVNTFFHNVIASVLAAEISIMANFVPNDYFTFRHIAAQHSRSWLARCLRFHMVSIGGSILTALIELGLTSLAHVPAIVSQAIALILVLFYNFSFHHLFTYRHSKPAESAVKNA